MNIKAERREKKRHKKRAMKVDGASVKQIARIKINKTIKTSRLPNI